MGNKKGNFSDQANACVHDDKDKNNELNKSNNDKGNLGKGDGGPLCVWMCHVAGHWVWEKKIEGKRHQTKEEERIW